MPGAPAIRFAGTLPRVLAWWLDLIIVGIGAGIVAGITGGFAGAATGDDTMAAAVTTVAFMGLELLYFVGFWTGTSRATPGMRLFNLQVGKAADGRTLSGTRRSSGGRPSGSRSGLRPAAAVRCPASGRLPSCGSSSCW